MEERKVIGSRTPEVQRDWIGAQFAEALGWDNIYFYNLNVPKGETKIEVGDLSQLTCEQKERLVAYYVRNGGALGFRQRMAARYMVVSVS